MGLHAKPAVKAPEISSEYTPDKRTAVGIIGVFQCHLRSPFVYAWAVTDSREDKRTGVVSKRKRADPYWEAEYTRLMQKWR